MFVATVDVPASFAILDDARRVWSKVRTRFRDGCLEVGRLLRRYVIERVSEADGVPQEVRLDWGFTRERAVEDAAQALELGTGRCHELMRVAAAVAVLSDDGDVGQLSYNTLRSLAVLVERDPAITRGKIGRPPSAAEAYHPKVVEGVDPVELFQRCVRDDWSGERTREAMRQLPLRRHGGRKSGQKEPRSQVSPLFAAAERATVKDLADMVLELISKHPDAGAVRDLLRGSL